MTVMHYGVDAVDIDYQVKLTSLALLQEHCGTLTNLWGFLAQAKSQPMEGVVLYEFSYGCWFSRSQYGCGNCGE